MTDKYRVYRPLLNLIGFTEGTDKGDGYNETLGYGIMLDGRVSKGKGTDVVLTRMTLDQVDRLQSRMLKDPDNRRLNSSAAGRYQIVRTTRRAIEKTLGLSGSELFDADMQDRMACFLLGQRGVDKYLAGRLSEDTLINNLAKEWASLPTVSGNGHYGGQRAAVSTARVRAVLADVRKLHRREAPAKEVVPPAVDEAVKEKSSWWQKVIGFFGGGGAAGGFLWGFDWETVAVIGGVTVILIAMVVIFKGRVVAAIRDVRKAVEEG